MKQGKYTAFAVQFETTAQTDIAIKDLFTINSAFQAAATVSAGGDEIWMWDSDRSDWNKYFYRGGRGVDAAKVGWTKAGEDDITTDTIKVGETAFFKRGGNDATLTLAGGVKAFSAAGVTFSCAQGKYTFLAYPWPISLKVTDFTSFLVDGTPQTAATVSGGGDEIWLWDTDTSDWVKYFYRGGRGVDPAKVGWTKAGEDDITTESIPAATGFFYKRGGNTVTVTFTYLTAE